MKFKLSAIALLAMIVPAQARTPTLSDAEATFLDQLVTAATVLEQRCTGCEVDGVSAVQLGARLLGSVDAAMAMIAAYDAPYRPTIAMPTTRVSFALRCPRRPAKR